MLTKVDLCRQALTHVCSFALLLAGFSYTASGAVSGSITTTNTPVSGCVQVNGNIYQNKTDVFLSSGSTGAGMTNGSYYVQVTAPGGTLLGTSVNTANPTPFMVVNGHAAQCYQLWSLVFKASNSGLQGYDTTGNAGSEYKVTVSLGDPSFSSNTKSDNFKVKISCDASVESCTPDPPPPPPTVSGYKYYDKDGSGTVSAGDIPLPGWAINGSNGLGSACTNSGGSYGFVLLPYSGPFTLSEAMPAETNWVATGVEGSQTVGPVGQTGDVTGPTFLNACTGAGGGLSLGFWSNQNGEKILTGTSTGSALLGGNTSLLTPLHLKDASGNDYDPAPSYSSFKSWLLGGTATNMAYMLSVQLATMELAVYNSKVSGASMVYAPALATYGLTTPGGFISITALMGAADTELGLHGLTPAGDPNRVYQETLKNVLDAANNNRNFLQAGPCAYTFPSCSH
jgi:hypothetical protein